MISNRYNYIDFLRFIGLFLIILAHVYSPNVIHQIRCFDVPLMLFVSGLAYGNRTNVGSFKDFIGPRAKKILLPTYIFVVFDLVALWIYHRGLTTTFILESLFLCSEGGVGYVWIMKVFLLVALVTPMLIKLKNKLSPSLFFALILITFIAQEFIVRLTTLIELQPLRSIYEETIPYLIGYSIPFMLGLLLRDIPKKQELRIIGFIVVGCVISLCLMLHTHGHIIDITPFYKYPPFGYYLIYGLFVSVILWLIRPSQDNDITAKSPLFVGRNTIWIYIWHIPFVTVFNLMFDNWILKWLLVFFCAVGVYYIQYQFAKKLKKRYDLRILDLFIG